MYNTPQSCTIYAGTVQLNYWPVSTVPGHFNLTITPTAIGIVIAVDNGATVTSPTVYLSYEMASAQGNCGNTVGQVFPGAVLSMRSDAVSSIAYHDSRATSLNYADFNLPLPASVALKGMCASWAIPLEWCLPIRPE